MAMGEPVRAVAPPGGHEFALQVEASGEVIPGPERAAREAAEREAAQAPRHPDDHIEAWADDYTGRGERP